MRGWPPKCTTHNPSFLRCCFLSFPFFLYVSRICLATKSLQSRRRRIHAGHDKPICFVIRNLDRWTEDLHRHWSEEDTETARRPMKSCSASRAIREFRMKATVRVHLTLVRIAILNKSTDRPQGLERMWREGNPSAPPVGMQTGAATGESAVQSPQQTKSGTAF